MTTVVNGKIGTVDIARVDEMLHGTYDDVGSCFRSESTLGQFRPPCFDTLSRANAFHLAMFDGQVVGCVAMDPVSSYPIVNTPCPSGTMLVHSLCVHHNARGQAIGTTLLKHALSGMARACLTIHRRPESSGKHADEVVRRYPKLVQLYAKHGFVRVGFDEHYDVWVRCPKVSYTKHSLVSN